MFWGCFHDLLFRKKMILSKSQTCTFEIVKHVLNSLKDNLDSEGGNLEFDLKNLEKTMNIDL